MVDKIEAFTFWEIILNIDYLDGAVRPQLFLACSDEGFKGSAISKRGSFFYEHLFRMHGIELTMSYFGFGICADHESPLLFFLGPNSLVLTDATGKEGVDGFDFLARVGDFIEEFSSHVPTMMTPNFMFDCGLFKWTGPLIRRVTTGDNLISEIVLDHSLGIDDLSRLTHSMLEIEVAIV